jgi:hypothetical protein
VSITPPSLAPGGQVFLIGPIGERGSLTRKRSDDIFDFLIKPAAEACNLGKCNRSVDLTEPGSITDQIIERLIEDDLVIADLHEHNPNVFYELAIRHTTGKPCILIAEEGDRLPFDVHGIRTIFFKHDDVRYWDEAKRHLIAQIQKIQASPSPPDTMVTTAFELLKLRRNQGLLDVFGMMEKTRPARALVRQAKAEGRTWRELSGSELAMVDALCRSFDLLGVYDRLGIVNSLHVDLMYAVPFVELYEPFLEAYVAYLREPEQRGKKHFWELVQFYERVKHVPSNHPAETGASVWPTNPRGPRSV